MSALGQKQTSRHLQPMSALPPIADIGTQSWNVRFVPKDICGAANCTLFDHLIGTSLQRLWHGQTECFGGLEINGKFVLVGSLNRKIGGLLTSKNAIDIIRRLTKLVNPIRVASCIISSRKIDPPTGPVTIKPPSAEWAKVATARSISPASRTPTGLISTPRDCAAPWIALNWPIADG